MHKLADNVVLSCRLSSVCNASTSGIIRVIVVQVDYAVQICDSAGWSGVGASQLPVMETADAVLGTVALIRAGGCSACGNSNSRFDARCLYTPATGGSTLPTASSTYHARRHWPCRRLGTWVILTHALQPTCLGHDRSVAPGVSCGSLATYITSVARCLLCFQLVVYV